MISLKLSATRTAKMIHRAMSSCTVNLNLQAFLRHCVMQATYAIEQMHAGPEKSCDDIIARTVAAAALTMRLESPAA